MSERPIDPMAAFEVRLSQELRDLSDHALRRIDPAVVTGALAAARPSGGIADRLAAVFPRRIAWTVVIALAIAALGLALLAAGKRSPVLPGRGLLAYVEHPVGPQDINDGTLYVADPDGANARVVLRGVGGNVSWSHSGRYLSVMREVPASNLQGTILIFDASGRQAGSIDAGENADYRWSPVLDELVVVGQARAGAIIRIYRPDGSLVRPVETPPGVTTVVNGIDWSPDGRRIVIAGCIGCQDSKYDDTPDLIWDLWIVKADGTGSTRLTTSPLETELRPAWSPDGGRIAYGVACRSDLRGCPDGSGGTWIIRADGTERSLEIADGGSVLWSPDGTRLAFERMVGGMPDVYVANADGTHQAPLTTDPGQDSPMAWSPDGSRLLFLHVAAGNLMADRPAEIWAINADGTHATRLATGSGDAGWQPLP